MSCDHRLLAKDGRRGLICADCRLSAQTVVDVLHGRIGDLRMELKEERRLHTEDLKDAARDVAQALQDGRWAEQGVERGEW